MFDNIIGNDNNKNKLNRIVRTKNVSHSYIFSGISGIGKFLFAKEFAKAIMCMAEKTERKPCLTCKSCESFKDFNNPKIIKIDEGEETIKTETIKEMVKNVLEKPVQSKNKVYIINNGEKMTREAQNSLLKTLEEPPEYAVIILVTSNENMLLNTIRSRCIKISFDKLTDSEIKKYFELSLKNIDNNIIKAAEGSISKALQVQENSELYLQIEEVFENIEKMNELQILQSKDKIFKEKDEAFGSLDYMNTIFYKKILVDPSKILLYQKCIEIIEQTKLRLKKNSNYDMAIDNCLLAIGGSLKENG